jgi:hypothetical protein
VTNAWKHFLRWAAQPLALVFSKSARIVLAATLLAVIPAVAATGDKTVRPKPAAHKAPRNLLGGSSEEFVDLAHRVISGTDGERSEFARISLEEMAAAFQQEAQRALDTKPDPRKPVDKDRDPRKWAAGTNSFAGRLFALADAVRTGATVAIRVEQEGSIVLTINGSEVIVSGPNIDKPQILEKRITDRVCLDPDCQTLATADSGFGSGSIGGRWSFADANAPVFVTNNGLNFLFEDRDNLSGKERACTELGAELDAVVQSIKNLLWQHQTVDWSALSVREDSMDATEQILRVNNNGDFVKLSLPRLVKAPYVLQSAMPWVRSQVEGHTTQHYVQLPPGIF